MNEIQELFDKSISEAVKPEVFLKKIVKDEFIAINIELSEEQLDDLSVQILSKRNKKISIELEDDQLLKTAYKSEKDAEKDIHSIFQLLPEKVEEKVNDFTKNLPKVMESSSKETANFLLSKILHELQDYLLPRRQTQEYFESGIEETWGESLDLLEAFISISLESGEKFHEGNVEISEENNYTYEVLFRLHARACQISLEILTLLKSGFADGAYARWRSLYEITIISYFIADQGNYAAKKYHDYQFIENYKAALQFQEYGTDYKKGSYGWAASALNKKSPTFRDIELSVNLDHFRPYYKMASYNVHAGSKSLYFRLGAQNEDPIMLAGASNLGFAEPCRFTAISLSQITVNLILSHEPNMDLLVTSQMLMKLEKNIERTVTEAEELLLSAVEEG